jgi:hypothetical protein
MQQMDQRAHHSRAVQYVVHFAAKAILTDGFCRRKSIAAENRIGISRKLKPFPDSLF